MGRSLRVAAVVAGLFGWNLAAVHDLSASALQSPASAQLKVFLDCQNCFSDFLRSEIEFVDYVRDPTEAEVHVLITRAQTGSVESNTRSRSSGGDAFKGSMSRSRR